jgi:urease accessory protein
MDQYPRLQMPSLTPFTGTLEEPAQDPDPQSGWQGRLRLCLARREDRTVLATSRQRGPLTVQRPFYPEGEVCHLYLLHPPGGVVGGDDLRLDVGLGIGAQALITTPGAGKLYRSDGRVAELSHLLEVGPDGCLEWLPQETILFDGARARLRTQVELHQRARFLGWEIYCLGRPSSGERFTSGDAELALELCREGEPRLLERLHLEQGSRLDAGPALRGHAVTATLLATPAGTAELAVARALLGQHPETCAGATLLEDLLVVRLLGPASEPVRGVLLALWRTLRPAIASREPVSPRIWAT